MLQVGFIGSAATCCRNSLPPHYTQLQWRSPKERVVMTLPLQFLLTALLPSSPFQNKWERSRRNPNVQNWEIFSEMSSAAFNSVSNMNPEDSGGDCFQKCFLLKEEMCFIKTRMWLCKCAMELQGSNLVISFAFHRLIAAIWGLN